MRHAASGTEVDALCMWHAACGIWHRGRRPVHVASGMRHAACGMCVRASGVGGGARGTGYVYAAGRAQRGAQAPANKFPRENQRGQRGKRAGARHSARLQGNGRARRACACAGAGAGACAHAIVLDCKVTEEVDALDRGVSERLEDRHPPGKAPSGVGLQGMWHGRGASGGRVGAVEGAALTPAVSQ